MLRVLDQSFFRLGIVAPQQEYHRLFPLIQQADHIICELLPALSPVRIGLTGADGEHSVQKQHTVLGPVGQLSVLSKVVNAHIFLDLFKYIDQRGRRRNSLTHGKAQAVCLIRPVVGILPQDHSLDICIGGVFEGVEDIIHAGVDGLCVIFGQQKLPQLLVVCFCKFAF